MTDKEFDRKLKRIDTRNKICFGTAIGFMWLIILISILKVIFNF